MYVIIVYDISVEEVSKICQFLRQYLNWIQNSVFEGELTDSEMKKIEIKLKDMINEKRDSIIIYRFPSAKILKKETIGINKSDTSPII